MHPYTVMLHFGVPCPLWRPTSACSLSSSHVLELKADPHAPLAKVRDMDVPLHFLFISFSHSLYMTPYTVMLLLGLLQQVVLVFLFNNAL